MAPRAMPSMATKMSLWGVWTKTPGRPGVRTAVDRLVLPPRADLSRDIVTLLQFLALDGPALDVRRGRVRVDQVDLDLAEVARIFALGAVDEQGVTGDQPVVGT